jgi:hypothetical protein
MSLVEPSGGIFWRDDTGYEHARLSAVSNGRKPDRFPDVIMGRRATAMSSPLCSSRKNAILRSASAPADIAGQLRFCATEACCLTWHE